MEMIKKYAGILMMLTLLVGFTSSLIPQHYYKIFFLST